MMFLLIQIMFAVAAGFVALILSSETFADATSRRVESAFDFIEYRLALRESRRRDLLCDEHLYVGALVQEKL